MKDLQIHFFFPTHMARCIHGIFCKSNIWHRGLCCVPRTPSSLSGLSALDYEHSLRTAVVGAECHSISRHLKKGLIFLRDIMGPSCPIVCLWFKKDSYQLVFSGISGCTAPLIYNFYTFFLQSILIIFQVLACDSLPLFLLHIDTPNWISRIAPPLLHLSKDELT